MEFTAAVVFQEVESRETYVAIVFRKAKAEEFSKLLQRGVAKIQERCTENR
jgi:hypothetical protein